MNAKAILDFMDKVTDAVKAASPVATMLGIPLIETVAGWADVAVDVGKNALARAEEAKIVLTSQDEADINVRINTLRAINDDLAKFIRDS